VHDAGDGAEVAREVRPDEDDAQVLHDSPAAHSTGSPIRWPALFDVV
jgi:hypothetical protein